MSIPPSPPPPAYTPQKNRPSVVTKYANYILISSIICIIFGVADFFIWGPPANYIFGIIFVILGVFFLFAAFGFYSGQSWALKMSGYSGSLWAQDPEVRAYFGLPPSNMVYVQPAPAAAPLPQTMCPTCGQPLTYIQQYNRWYCNAEQKYV